MKQSLAVAVLAFVLVACGSRVVSETPSASAADGVPACFRPVATIYVEESDEGWAVARGSASLPEACSGMSEGQICVTHFFDNDAVTMLLGVNHAGGRAIKYVGDRDSAALECLRQLSH